MDGMHNSIAAYSPSRLIDRDIISETRFTLQYILWNVMTMIQQISSFTCKVILRGNEVPELS